LRLLITGGTGFIGSRVKHISIKRGHRLRILSRETPVDNLNADWVVGDITSPDDCVKAVSDVDAIIHAAAEKHRKEKYHSVNVKGTENLIHAAKKRGIKRFIHMSSVGVIGAAPFQRRVFDESALCNPNEGYERSKWESEQITVKASNVDMSVAVLRPANVFGEQDPAKGLLTLARKIRHGQFFFVGGRNSICNFVHVDDVACAAITLVELSSHAEGVYHICDSCTIGDFVDSMADAMEVKRPTRTLPVATSILLRYVLMSMRNAPVISDSAVFSRLVALNNQADFSSLRLRNETGFEFKVGWREGVKRLISWYQEQGDL
jgi:nucleoside-diphosphate-sugar epimerase